MEKQVIPGTDGDKYVPYESRDGQESVVYFTSDLSAEGLLRIFEKVGMRLTEKSASNCIQANRMDQTLSPDRGSNASLMSGCLARQSWRQIPTMKATATRPHCIGKHLPSTAGHFVKWISWMKRGL